MKKNKLLLIPILIISMFCATACDQSQPEPLPTVSAEIIGEQLNGTYVYAEQFLQISLEFRKNNTVGYTVSVNKENEYLEGSYVLNDDDLIIKNSDGKSIKCKYNKNDDLIELEGKTLSKIE